MNKETVAATLAVEIVKHDFPAGSKYPTDSAKIVVDTYVRVLNEMRAREKEIIKAVTGS